MNGMMFTTRCLVALLGVAAGVLHANENAPILYPQWITSFSRDVLAYDSIASLTGPTWTSLPNGEFALVTTGGTMLVRRFAADGSVRTTERVPLPETGFENGTTDVIMKGDPSGDGVYLMVGSSFACQLLRLDPDLRISWSVPVPGTVPYTSRCRDLEVLPDGSALALREYSLARIDRVGHSIWVVNHGDGGRWFYASDMTVDGTGTIWVAARGGLIDDGGGNDSSTLRYGLDGSLLSADELHCKNCIASFAMSVDAISDGSVFVGGGSGSGQPGFLARYDAAGKREWVVDTADDVDYSRVAHDAHSALYVQASDGVNEVRRIDSETANVLWSIEADDFTATDDGVVVTRRSDDETVAISLDAAGHVRWARALSTDPYFTISRGLYVGGELQILLRESMSTSSTCGVSPQLIGWNSSGVAVRSLQACLEPEDVEIRALDAQPDVGLLANLGYRLVSFTPDGDQRWGTSLCELCGEVGHGEGVWITATMTSDGGAWAVAWRPAPSLLDSVTSIERIDANGEIVASVEAVAGAASNTTIRLLGTSQDAVMLETPYRYGVTWQRVRSDGVDFGARTFAIPDNDFRIEDARRMPDDSVTVVVKGHVYCNVGCAPHYTTILRIAGDGSLMWRYQFPEWDPAVALDDAGGASAVLSRYSDGWIPQLKHIAPDGTVGADLPLLDVTLGTTPLRLAGAIDGHWLLATEGGFPNGYALWLVDAQGHVSASASDAYVWMLSTSRFGFLVSALETDTANVLLLDPATLMQRAEFFFGTWGTWIDDYGPYPWRVLDDGTVYGTLLSRRDGFRRMGLARYSIPGSPPANLLFRYGFE